MTLEPWIKLANLLPPDAPLPEPAMLQPEGEHRKMLRQLYRAFHEEFRVPDPDGVFPKHVFPKGVSILAVPTWQDDGMVAWSQHRFESGEQLYSLFHAVRAALGAIAEACAKERPAAQISSTGSVGEAASIVAVQLRSVNFTIPLAPTETVAFVEQDGTLQFHHRDMYREFLRSIEGVEVTRLRRCPVCGRFFWAQREDKSACSARCGDTYRVRFYRDRAPKYAANRRQNRRVKKARTEGRTFK